MAAFAVLELPQLTQPTFFRRYAQYNSGVRMLPAVGTTATFEVVLLLFLVQPVCMYI